MRAALLKAALAYAARGWAVFPCWWVQDEKCACPKGAECTSPGKHPLTDHGFKDAAADEVTIRTWWKRWPKANVAIATGSVSKLIVIDIDPRNGGDVSLDSLLAELGALPDTLRALTQSKGQHFYFAYTDIGVGCSNGVIAAGIDVKSDGGYVVAAPSAGILGEYSWDTVSGEPDDPVADIPPAWLDRLVPAARSTATAAPAVSGPIPAGERNSTLASVAGSLRRRNLPEAVIAVTLQQTNLQLCVPPLPEEEVAAIARSIAKYQPAANATPEPAASFDAVLVAIENAPSTIASDADSSAIEAILEQVAKFAPVAKRALLAGLKAKTGLPLTDLRDALKLQAHDRMQEDQQRQADDGSAGCAYRATFWGLVQDRKTPEGTVEVRLTNFIARIRRNILFDDGADQEVRLDIEAALEGKKVRIEVSAARFASMSWVLTQLGSKAIVFAGMGIADHARTAIQTLSGDSVTAVVYGHTGWRDIDGRGWCYLTGSGAIGPNGPEAGVEVNLRGSLSSYQLPVPPKGEDRRLAVLSALQVTKLAAPCIAYPLFAAIWRAALMQCDFSLALTGPTGVLKTACAGCVQSFWGPSFDDRHLPASWTGTGNALEGIAFLAKDVVLVIDDFAPSGSNVAVQQLHALADRVLRAQGNNAGRVRMTSETKIRSARYPRGLIISTGEDVPAGQSLRARMLILEVVEGDVDVAVLTACQKAGRDGQLAQTMAAFIQDVAGNYDAVRDRLKARSLELRATLEQRGQHRRVPTLTAELLAAAEIFYEFAVKAEAVDQEHAAAELALCRIALLEAASNQAKHQQHAEPTEVFLDLLSAAIVSGEAYVASMQGVAPANAGSLGWRANSGRPADPRSAGWVSHGICVGWIDGRNLYLNLEAAYKAAQRMAQDSGGLTVHRRTLAKRLFDKGLLLSVERDKHTVRRSIQGVRQDVLHLSASHLIEQALQAHQAQGGPADGTTGESGPETVGPESHEAKVSGPAIGTTPTPLAERDQPSGPSGPNGPEQDGDAGGAIQAGSGPAAGPDTAVVSALKADLWEGVRAGTEGRALEALRLPLERHIGFAATSDFVDEVRREIAEGAS